MCKNTDNNLSCIRMNNENKLKTHDNYYDDIKISFGLKTNFDALKNQTIKNKTTTNTFGD